MRRFTVEISRQVSVYDIVERVIEAETQDEAQAKADAMAVAFSAKCPSDYRTVEPAEEMGDWSVDSVGEVQP